MAKIFISYKYADNQVWQGIDQKYWAIEENPWTGQKTRVNQATGRAYVNYLQEIIGEENVYKGEKENESLAGKSDDQIWEILKPKVHDSTVTLVVISPGMKDPNKSENSQWMPHEIRYSLREVERGERTSRTNALLGVVLPDYSGKYEYIFGKSSCQHCCNVRILNKYGNPYLFNILKGNIFNRKNDNGQPCQGLSCNTTIYEDGHSYLHLVTLKEFETESQKHIDTALKIKENADQYNIEKTI